MSQPYTQPDYQEQPERQYYDEQLNRNVGGCTLRYPHTHLVYGKTFDCESGEERESKPSAGDEPNAPVSQNLAF